MQVLANAGALDRDKRASGPNVGAAHRGTRRRWGLSGHAKTNEELVRAAGAQIAQLQAKQPQSQH